MGCDETFARLVSTGPSRGRRRGLQQHHNGDSRDRFDLNNTADNRDRIDFDDINSSSTSSWFSDGWDGLSG